MPEMNFQVNARKVVASCHGDRGVCINRGGLLELIRVSVSRICYLIGHHSYSVRTSFFVILYSSFSGILRKSTVAIDSYIASKVSDKYQPLADKQSYSSSPTAFI